ncbi:hypothetical protein ANN_00087 [Periplaneta americana]|uniref:Malonyl-CoA:ACP transacylase (MAT) domain-containing protein n=1 Tax=Periplaneta americana TaxID=6978 RepID=A0ABQ8TSK9_PERAM|nr:hypothetical protein ANN_00087 [Periplaneta americana]
MHYQGSRRPVWYVFTGMGSQWTGMGKAFLSIPIFAAAIDKCQRALQPYGVDVHHIITTDDPTIFDNILNCFVGIAACQIGLVDIMNAVGIEADGIVGHSVGELGCSYMDGCFTAEQMVLAAYFRGRASIETELIDGLMAAVGLGAKEMKKLCPPDIEVACHNGPAFCTLSGPTESMKTFVKSLQQRGVFAKEVNCANIAYHSKYIAGAGPALLKYLKQVIPNPKPRSPLWVSSSVPESEWDTPLAKLSSAEYHTNNLLGSVLFEDACKHIPNNAITIEIAPHGLLQAILKRSLDKNIINIAVTQRGHPNGTEVLFSALGRLYELGLQPQLTRLYPQIEYPVSRGTPMLSPLVQWEHSEDFFVMIYKQAKGKASERHLTVSWEDKSKQFLSGSVIDGRNVFPAMGFIEIVWETFALVTDQVYTDFPVVFENVRFHRPVDIPKQGDLELGVMVQKGSGRFEVTHSGSLVVSGVVLTSDKISQQLAVLQPLNQDGSELSSQDVYRELSLRGYNYESQFQSIASLHARDEVVEVSMYSELGIIRAGLVEVRGLKSVWINRHPPTGQIVLEERVFVPYEEYASLDYWTASRACLHIVLENQQGSVVKVVELNQNGLKPISPQVELLLRDVPNTEASLLRNKSSNQGNMLISWMWLQVDLTLLGSENCLLDRGSSVKVKDHQLTAEKDCTLIMSSSILQHADLLRTAVDVLSDGAYILAREKPDSKSPGFNDTRLEVVMEKTCEHEKLVLLKKVMIYEGPYSNAEAVQTTARGPNTVLLCVQSVPWDK